MVIGKLQELLASGAQASAIELLNGDNKTRLNSYLFLFLSLYFCLYFCFYFCVRFVSLYFVLPGFALHELHREENQRKVHIQTR